MIRIVLYYLILCFAFTACTKDNKNSTPHKILKHLHSPQKKTVIVDCNYSFEEAVAGSKAPKWVLDELTLLNVRYYSVDGRIHAGQIITNKKMAEEVRQMFAIMFREKFPVAQAIPIVKYHWNDDLSMNANNTSSFCYRNVSYSKHAYGMAIDINPFFNPVIWKKGYEYRKNKPVGALYDISRPGTFSESSTVVVEFQKLGLRWGHYFTRNYDNHHFGK